MALIQSVYDVFGKLRDKLSQFQKSFSTKRKASA
jgi:hypothetical protein